MTCHTFLDFLMDYLNGELPPGQHAVFEEHLGECPDCVAYLAMYRETVKLGKAAAAAPEAPVPEDLIRAILAARASS
jgi:anti-sigma factor RsiW